MSTTASGRLGPGKRELHGALALDGSSTHAWLVLRRYANRSPVRLPPGRRQTFGHHRRPCFHRRTNLGVNDSVMPTMSATPPAAVTGDEKPGMRCALGRGNEHRLVPSRFRIRMSLYSGRGREVIPFIDVRSGREIAPMLQPMTTRATLRQTGCGPGRDYPPRLDGRQIRAPSCSSIEEDGVCFLPKFAIHPGRQGTLIHKPQLFPGSRRNGSRSDAACVDRLQQRLGTRCGGWPAPIAR